MPLASRFAFILSTASFLVGSSTAFEASNDGHGEDDVAVLAAHVDIAQDIVGDAPYEVADVEGCSCPALLKGIG